MHRDKSLMGISISISAGGLPGTPKNATDYFQKTDGWKRTFVSAK